MITRELKDETLDLPTSFLRKEYVTRMKTIAEIIELGELCFQVMDWRRIIVCLVEEVAPLAALWKCSERDAFLYFTGKQLRHIYHWLHGDITADTDWIRRALQSTGSGKNTLAYP